MAGRTVLVTGASGGIGRATALGLARMGADLAICGRDSESTEDAASELSAAGGGPVEVFVAGLSAELEVRRGSTRRVRGRPGPARWSSWWLLASR
jgi:NAD(P)-dependent dehydrogenase (short-subunit alcohol dehydrogenase family)